MRIEKTDKGERIRYDSWWEFVEQKDNSGIFSTLVVSAGIVSLSFIFCPYPNGNNCNKDPQYIKQKSQIDYIYNLQVDSLEKDYQIKLKNLEEKFKI